MVQLRQQNPEFTRSADTEFLETGNRHVYGFLRDYEDHDVLEPYHFMVLSRVG